MLLISKESTEKLKEAVTGGGNVFCQGLFFSARWAVLSQTREARLNLVVLPDKESAEYCAADLYGMVEGDNVFFLPDSASNYQKSNFKDTATVQRTSALSKISSYDGKSPLYIITCPEGIEEKIPGKKKISEPVLKIIKGGEISHEEICSKLTESGFVKVDFVGAPGQFAIRGGIADIFSFDFNFPYRISFFGNEVDGIKLFDANSQLSMEDVDSAEIFPDLSIVDENFPASSLFDILPENTIVWLDNPDKYSEREFFSGLDLFQRVFLDCPAGQKETVKFNIAPQPVFNKNFELLTEDIKNRITKGYKVYIFSRSHSQKERLKDIFFENGGIVPEFVENGTIHEGFIDNDDRICCYSDHEIFDRFHRVLVRRTVDKTEQLTINELSSFIVGDYIVHIDLGIGIFGGLVRLKDDKGKFREVVKLLYKDNDVVYLSVHSLHKISKYRSKDGEPPRINKLGSKTWQNYKATTKKKVKDIARELIQLYARRKASRGFAFSPDSYLQRELESSFEWEDTPDQEKAMEMIKKDMEEKYPMDRLICGDVGFGKTELAVRAAFKAVADSKQVVVLVPTTILCLQHYRTFSSRLKNFPCTVEYVSRLRSAKEISEIAEKLREGRIDILIGTHKILSENFVFKDLGLLVIDEEQKFGVSAKERLRKMKLSVDTLTLTATPIPRTLQFSLLGARDLSILNTPPPNRVPVQTEIMLFNKDEIKSIINYELKRGGQIFFLHNKVEELESIRDILHHLVPEMSICVTHGRMESKTLENKILDFMAGEYDMLLCTTIIENGLDIPNANTIIINQAQNIGLSDLHQLRGRVGRSRTKGFCYLIVPPLVSISDDARKRLKAIEAFSDLGSGFSIAMQDLDIRGAGNLLGAQQSGFISEMGIETYQKILSEAMEELGMDVFEEENKTPQEESCATDCTVDTDVEALLPDDYVNVPVEKLRLYKELDGISSEKALDALMTRLKDRFGALPEEAVALFDIVRIRNIGRKLGFEKIIVKNGILICFFVSNPMSPYFKSSRFASVLDKVNANGGVFELKQTDSRLKLISKSISSLKYALDMLKKLE